MPKDCLSAGVQDRQDNGAIVSSQDCKCPGLYSQELYFLDMTEDLPATIKLYFEWNAKWHSGFRVLYSNFFKYLS